MNIRNLTFNFMQSEFAEGLGWVLLNSLWQFLIIAAIYYCFRAVFQNAQIRYVCGVALMGLAVATFMGTSFFVASQSKLADNESGAGGKSSRANNKTLENETPQKPEQNDHSLLTNADLLANKTAVPFEPQNISTSATSETASALESEVTFFAPVLALGQPTSWYNNVRVGMPYVVVVWCLGVILFAIRPILGFVFTYRVQKNQIDAVSQQLDSRISKLAAQMGIKKSIKLVQSAMVQVPMVVGYFRPLVILPLSLVTQFSTSEIDAILRHELAHIRRHDVLLNFFQSLIETVFFYHPCVWWISNQIRIERENCCDDAAVTGPGEAIQLANALFRLEETRVLPNGVAATGGELQSRIKRLVVEKTRMESKYVSMRLPAAIAATLVVFAVSLTAIASNAGSAQPFDDFGRAKTITVQSVGDSFTWKVIEFEDAKSVAQIQSHFPGLDKKTRGADPAGYEIDMQLSFKNDSGGKIVIGLNSTLGLWNRGNGDFLMSNRLDFLKTIRNHPKTKPTAKTKASNKSDDQRKKSLVKMKGSKSPIELDYDEETNTIMYRGSKEAVETFGAILKKHSDANLRESLISGTHDGELKTELNKLTSSLINAQASLDHSRKLFKKGFITQLQLDSDELQVRSLQEQIDSLQTRMARKSAQATADKMNRKKRVAIQQQIQLSRIKLAESELEVAMREYDRLKILSTQNSVSRSSLSKAKIELDRKRSELTILKLELDQIELNSKSQSANDKLDNSVAQKPKTKSGNKLELQILAAEIEYAKSALHMAIEKKDTLQSFAQQTGQTTQSTNAILAVKRLEADLRILELKYERAKTSASTELSNPIRPKNVRSPEIVKIELEFANAVLDMANRKLVVATELHKSGRSDQLQILDAKQKQLLAAKNLTVLQVELDSLMKSGATSRKNDSSKTSKAPPKKNNVPRNPFGN